MYLALPTRLGNLYLEGIGVDRDPAKALEYALRAGEGGFADSQNRVGYIYAEGVLGETRDSALALEWFKKAAAQGHDSAIKNVAELEAEAACAASAASQYEPQFAAIGRNFEAIDVSVAIPACEDGGRQGSWIGRG